MKVRKTDFQMKNEGAVPMQKILLFTSIPLYFNFNIDGKIFSVFVSENIYRYNICTYQEIYICWYIQCACTYNVCTTNNPKKDGLHLDGRKDFV